jgi:DNA-binding transcriptional LysR family regulator
VNYSLVVYFVAVIDHGGVTKAAQALYISQPSLSQAIRSLEKSLGTMLFDRTGGRMTLTEDGRRFEVYARRILADAERVREKVADVRALNTGSVEVVTYSLFTFDPMIELTRRFRARYPRVLVRIMETDGPTGVHTAVRRGEAEIGISDLSVEHEGMITVPLWDQELVLAAPPGLADLPERVPRGRVRDLPLVVDLADRSNVYPTDLIGDDATNVVVDCGYLSVTCQLVTRGVGASIVPLEVARREMPSVRVHRLDPPLSRPVGLVMRAGDPSPAAAALLAVASTSQQGG